MRTPDFADFSHTIRKVLPAAAWMAAVAGSLARGGEEEGIRRLNPGALGSQAVIVSGRELVHTTQLLPLDQQGQLVGAGGPTKQLERLFDQLANVLAAEGARPADVVKLNLYVTEGVPVRALEAAVQRHLSDQGPAISLVQTRLPVDGAMVALDAVAAREPRLSESLPKLSHSDAVAGAANTAHTAVLPLGEAIYISGQAEPGADLAEATTKTLAGLKKTLDHLGLGLEHVVQIKCFLQPMADVGQTFAAIEELFGERPVPPTSVVEWISSIPIEIEMIVSSPQHDAEPGVTFEWLPWLSTSDVYCRLTRVRGNTQIYIGACLGDPKKTESEQVSEAFETLVRRLEAAGSDLQHMAKATYYVTNDAASQAVNEIRPTLYDPQRPPAASKAMVYGTGWPGVVLMMDMIAVPAAANR